METVSTPTEPTATETCDGCGSPLRANRTFNFRIKPRQPNAHSPSVAQVANCLGCAIRHRPLLRRCLIASLVVGTLLTILNQGDTLVSGQWQNALYWKIPLTYCVPFCVAAYGALANSRQ